MTSADPMLAIARLASLDGGVTVSQLTELIERMITMEGKLTRGQLDQMVEQRQRMTARSSWPRCSGSFSRTISPVTRPG